MCGCDRFLLLRMHGRDYRSFFARKSVITLYAPVALSYLVNFSELILKEENMLCEGWSEEDYL